MNIRQGWKTLRTSFACAAALTVGGVTGAESPPIMTISREQGRLVLTFFGVLQTSETIAGPWIDLPGALSPWKVEGQESSRIYRSRSPRSIFDGQDPATITLRGPLQKGFELAKAGLPDGIVPPHREKHYAEGTLTLAEVDVPIRWRVRGNSSLQECPFPKLKFKVGRDDRAGTPFFDAREIKIGTHCAEGGRGTIGRLRDETATFREALAYEVTEELGFVGPRVRRARIHYMDTTSPGESGETGWTVLRNAVLVEDIEGVAKRLGGQVVDEPEAAVLTAANFDETLITALQFLHALLGNWDYSLATGPRGLWNTDVIALGNGRLLPVAGDFDLASWVTGIIRARFPSDYHPELDEIGRQGRFELERIRAEATAEAFAAAVDRFQRKRAALERRIEAALVDEPGRTNAQRHLTGFFDALASVLADGR